MHTIHARNLSLVCTTLYPVVRDPADRLSPRRNPLFLSKVPGELADYTQRAAASTVRAWLKFCERDELIERAPKVTMPDVDEDILPAFSEADIKKLWAATKTPLERTVMLFLLDTGVRAFELLALNGISHILRNRFYAGIAQWDGVETEGTHEAIIIRTEYDQAQTLIKSRKLGQR
jgi:integrase